MDKINVVFKERLAAGIAAQRESANLESRLGGES